MICENCGKNNKDTSRFCSECGKALIDKPIELDLQEIKIPAVSRKPKIIKVNKKSAEPKEQKTDVDSLFLPKEESDEMVNIPPMDTAAEENENNSEDRADFKIEEELGTQNQEISSEAENSEKPMSVGAWIITFILTAIPVLNIILLLVWAIGKKTNKSKKTFAAAVLILGAVCIVLGSLALFFLIKFTNFNVVESFNNKF